MNDTNKFSSITRLTHLLGAVLLLVSVATGARLLWFNATNPDSTLYRFIDRVAPAGSVVQSHIIAGVGLLVVGLVYLLHLSVSGELARLSSGNFYPKFRKQLYRLMLVATIVASITGLMLYAGIGSGRVFGWVKIAHVIMAVVVVITSGYHILELILTRFKEINSILLAPVTSKPINMKLLAPAMIVLASVAYVVYAVSLVPPTLTCRLSNSKIIIDGVDSEPEWRGADSVMMTVSGGANFGSGGTELTIKAQRNSRNIFFLIRWSDPEPSFNKHLIKTEHGWKTIETETPDLFGETVFSEDQLAISFHKDRTGCAGTCHLRETYLPGQHYTSGDTVDVWRWMAVSTNPVGEAMDGSWRGADSLGLVGVQLDNRASGGPRSNLNEDWRQPYILPNNPAIRNWITLDMRQVTPYLTEDDWFDAGAKIPGVLIAPSQGDVADVTARGRWFDGVWTVEFSRFRSTGSPVDLPINGEMFLGIALFNNAERRHAHHFQPIRLLVK